MNDIPRARHSPIPELVRQSEELEVRMAELQSDTPLPPQEVEALRREYRTWHAAAVRQIPEDSRKAFDEQRDGTIFSLGITTFLNEPRKESPIVADDGSFPWGRWQLPFAQVKTRLERQRIILQALEGEQDPTLEAARDLAAALQRIPEMIRTLAKLDANSFRVANEKDLQIIVEAFLRTVYDDVRPEDPAPTRAGASSRVDFVLPEVGILVETKMMRESLTVRRLGEELLVDVGRYPQHPDCRAIVAFVYDPERRISNPRGVERDLTTFTADGASVFCVIAS
jgi:hypothetical protein